jgi:hypothetical protein
MASVESLGWTEALAAEEAEVRERWCRVRAILDDSGRTEKPTCDRKKKP